MVIDAILLKRKLVQLKGYLEELARGKPSSFLEYQKSSKERRNAERLLQLIVETASDINEYILVESGMAPPEDYRTSFTELSRLSVLDPEFALEISKAAGLRNRLVHDYADIDDKIVYDSIDSALQQFSMYITAVNRIVS